MHKGHAKSLIAIENLKKHVQNVINVPADGLALFGAKPSTDTMMTKFCFSLMYGAGTCKR